MKIFKALESAWELIGGKLILTNNTYLCIEMSLSDTGVGAAANQYYIVENPYGLSSILNYYFFEKDIFPIIDSFN